MNLSKLWLPAVIGLAGLAVAPVQAAAQPKPITSCGTTVSTPGSYAVTQNLTATSASTPCIKVTSAPVTIDLGGFVLTGIGGSPGFFVNLTHGPLVISNGIIRSFKFGIVAPGARAKLRNVTVVNNQSDGANLGPSSEVIDSEFLNNGGNGLVTGAFALVVHCTFVGNSGSGLFAGTNAIVKENVASQNNNANTSTTLAGFLTNGHAIVTGNASVGNTMFDGFQDAVGSGTFEGNTGSSNPGVGFDMDLQSQVGQILGNNVFIGNSAVGNLAGIFDAGGSTFEANTVDGSTIDGIFSEEASTFVANTSNLNGSPKTGGFGFDGHCPINLVGNTAEDNISGGFRNDGTIGPTGCNFDINLGF